MDDVFCFAICSQLPYTPPPHPFQFKSLIHRNFDGYDSVQNVSLYFLSGRCRNSGPTANYRTIRSQTRYSSGGEQETEEDRHNPRFEFHYLAQTYFHITQILLSYVSILPSIYPFLTTNRLLFNSGLFHKNNSTACYLLCQ